MTENFYRESIFLDFSTTQFYDFMQIFLQTEIDSRHVHSASNNKHYTNPDYEL